MSAPEPSQEGGTGWLISQLRAQVEAMVLVADAPLHPEDIARILDTPVTDVEEACELWARELDERGSGIELRWIESATRQDSGWRLYTRREHAGAVEKLLLDGSQSRLSRAALETLAVVAYRQPVTRAQVSAVRGVNVDGVMRTLAVRGLIREVESSPDPDTGAHRWVTTELFLEQLGIDSLERLPDLAPLLPDIDNIDADEFLNEL